MFGEQPVGTTSAAIPLTLPLQGRLSDLPLETVIYEGNNSHIDALLAVANLAKPVTVANLITNLGDAVLSYQLKGITFDHGGNTDFYYTEQSEKRGHRGTTLPIALYFQPNAIGLRQDMMRVEISNFRIEHTSEFTSLFEAMTGFIESIYINRKLTFELTGVGTLPLTVDTPLVAFGRYAVGTESTGHEVEVTSVTGVAMELRVALSGEHASDFRLRTNPCDGQTLNPGDRCRTVVTFAPTGRGGRMAELVFMSSITNNLITVPISGFGTTAIATLSTNALDFGVFPMTTATHEQFLAITNTGDEVLLIDSIELEGTHANCFVITAASDLSASIQVGGAAFIAISFAPQAVGKNSATLRITTNAGDSPHLVSLTGFGTPAAELRVAVAAHRPTVMAGERLIYTVTLHNAGPSTAVGVILEFQLSPFTTFERVDLPAYTPPIGATGAIVYKVDNLPSDGMVTMKVIVIVHALPDTAIESMARVAVSSFDPTYANNTARISTPVVAPPPPPPPPLLVEDTYPPEG